MLYFPSLKGFKSKIDKIMQPSVHQICNAKYVEQKSLEINTIMFLTDS